MLKSPKSWLKNCVTTPFPDILLLLFFVLLISACAAPKQTFPPRADLGDPLRGTNVPSNQDFREAYQKYLQGNQQSARSKLLEITQKSPEYYPAYLTLGYSYLAEQNNEYAESYIRKAIEINQDYAQARFVLSNILESRQDYAAALEQLNEVVRIDPQFPALAQAQNVLKLKVTEQYLNTGRQLANSDPEQALKYLKTAHDMAPEVAQIPVEIADILLRQNNCPEAINYLKIAVEKSPEDTDSKTRLAECYSKLGEFHEAQNIYEELAMEMPNNPTIQNRLEEIRKQIFINSLPQEYQNIPHTTEITRAQLSAYLVVNLESLKKYRSDNQQIVVDIIQHWAQSYIQKVVSLGIMDVYPNRTFQPNQPLTKLELAKAVSRILEIVELSGQGKFPADPGLIIPDIPPGHLYYGLVARPLSTKIIKLEPDGRFHASRRVTGPEAIAVVNQLKSLLEPL